MFAFIIFVSDLVVCIFVVFFLQVCMCRCSSGEHLMFAFVVFVSGLVVCIFLTDLYV